MHTNLSKSDTMTDMAPTTVTHRGRVTVRDLAPTKAARPVVLSYGMGVDSTAILLRWLFDASSRDFDLSDLIVITAQTGDEWERTGADVERYILPLLRALGVRYVQVARNRPNVNKSNALDAVTVLDDSTSPTKVYLEGDYKLSDEMFEGGTVPQLGGTRKCSMHAKGWALDPAIAKLTGGRRFRHVIGFEANEPKRSKTDKTYDVKGYFAPGLRVGEYPLQEWGWDRAKCEAYIQDKLDVAWAKSACTMCPFAMSCGDSRTVVFKRYEDEDRAAGTKALLMEHCSLAFNTEQGLLGERHLVDLVAKAGYYNQADRLADALDSTDDWGLYEVKRITGMNWRKLVRVADGSRADMDAALRAQEGEFEVGRDGIARVWLRHREPGRKTTVEHFFVVAPALANDKARPTFNKHWTRQTYLANMRARDRARRASEATS